jgi:DNA-binding LytR/AlgR family response regulator
LALFKNETNQNKLEVDYIFIKDSNEHIKLPYSDITYIRSSGNYIEIHTSSKRHLIRSSIKEILAKLPEGKFIQTHKSFAINLDHLSSFNTNAVHINEIEVPIGRSYKENVKEILKSD